jgi:hypothetical protein
MEEGSDLSALNHAGSKMGTYWAAGDNCKWHIPEETLISFSQQRV